MSAQPSAACCTIPPVQSNGYYKKGEYLTVGGIKTYVTGPPSAKKAILVVYDIFGFSDQMLQGADILALSDTESGPYRVFVPDFFAGKAADISWYPPTTDEHKTALQTFFGGIGNPARTIPRIPGIVKSIRDGHSSIEKVFALGLCWGGKVITVCSAADSPFDAVAMAHPAMIDPEDAKKVKVPTLLLPSKDEDTAEVDAFIANLTVPHRVETFSDQVHGWMAARADLANPTVAEKYREGYRLVLEFFAQPRGGSLEHDTTISTVLWSLQSAEEAEKLIDFVRTIPLRAKKDGKTYILSAKAGTTKGPFPGRPSRAQGYNVVTIIEFRSLDDAAYWGATDPVHRDMVFLSDEPKYKDTIAALFTSNDKTFLQPKDVGA